MMGGVQGCAPSEHAPPHPTTSHSPRAPQIGAPFHGLKAFFTTPQLSTVDKLANSLALGTSPIVR